MKRVRGEVFRRANPKKESFRCPICDYMGPFMDAHDATGLRKHAMCPTCSSLERHRVLWLSLQKLAQSRDFKNCSLLHFAPEPQLEMKFRNMFGAYATADLQAKGVDFLVDLRSLPFESASYDVVIASHVLEHIQEDHLALENIKRILKPGGIALLQVPLICEKTLEYGRAIPEEWHHVRAPGNDYFDRYRKVFRVVEEYTSSQFDPTYQPYVFENRSRWPKAFSHRPTSKGDRHEDVVPVAYA